MKRILVIAMFFALCLSALAQNHTKMSGSKTEGKTSDVSSMLQDMEKKWAAASAKSDCESIASMIADNWVSTSPDGKVHSKSDMIQECKNSKLTQSEVSDMKVHQVNKDVAIVTGKWTGTGTGSDGKSVGGPERWTDTFVKEGGQWKCVASQATKIAGDQSQTAEQ